MELSPQDEIVFKVGDPAATSKNTLTINNKFSETIAFKVKTTAPNQFVVRPNSGKIAPGEDCKVTIILQVSKAESLDVKKREKFLVQGIKIPQDIALNESQYNEKIASLWSMAETLKKNQSAAAANSIFEAKIRCIYITEQNELTPNRPTQAPSISVSNDRNSVYKLAETSQLPAGSTARKATISVSAPSEVQADKESSQTLKEAKEKIAALEAVCNGYKQEVERLKNLRQRRGDSVIPSIQPSVATKQIAKAQGVEMNVVVLLCLLSFVFGVWMF